MIKFRKILQKAARRPGPTVAVATPIADAADSPRQPTQDRPAVALEYPPESEVVSAVAAVEPAVADLDDARLEPKVTSNELIEDVLEQTASQDKETPEDALPAGESPEPAYDSGVSPEEAALLTQPGEDVQPPPSALPETEASDESFIESLIDDAFAAVSKAEGAGTEGAPEEPAPGPQGNSPDEQGDDAPQTQQIDESFVSEIDKLLNTFGRMDELPQADVSASGATLDSGRDAAAERLVSETIEALAKNATQAQPPASEESPQEPTGAASVAPSDGPAAPPEDAFPEEQEMPVGDFSQELQIVTKEEKEALFAAAEQDELSVDVDELATAVESEVEQAASSTEGFSRTGTPAEVEFDFTPAAVGMEERPEKASRSEADDLLSKVLADLDKLGPVEKPPKEVEPEPVKKEEIEDFSQILSELNAEQAQAALRTADVGPSPETDQTRGMDVNAVALTEEELIDEAIKAADETPPTEGIGPNDENTAASPQDKVGDAAAGENEPARDEEQSDRAAARKPEDDDFMPGAADFPESDTDATDSAQTDLDKTGGADALQDEKSLLANLEASMGEPEGKTGTDSPKKNDAKDRREESEEDHIRNQVLSRSREVEKKILDDVFGDQKDYRAEVKAELSAVEALRQESGERGASAKTDALSTDSHTAFEGTLAPAGAGHAGPVYDGHFGVFWLAFQINRPFLRWLNTPALRLLGAMALALLTTALVWLAASIIKVWYSL